MIVIDDREVLQHPTIPSLLKCTTKVERLEAADFAFSTDREVVGIERATVSNLLQKLHSGQLESQLTNCSKLYTKTFLIIEGVYDNVGGLIAIYSERRECYYRNRVYPTLKYSSITGLIVRLLEMGVKIVWTANLQDTLEAVQSIYSNETTPEGSKTLFKTSRRLKMPVKYTTNPAVPRLLALVDRMPERTAIKLIDRFGSIWGVLNATDKELKEVDGMGKTLIARLKEGVGK